jgi:hypothetical protein
MPEKLIRQSLSSVMAGLYVVMRRHEAATRLISWADTKPSSISFAEAYEEGKKMTLDEAVAYALEEN